MTIKATNPIDNLDHLMGKMSRVLAQAHDKGWKLTDYYYMRIEDVEEMVLGWQELVEAIDLELSTEGLEE